MSIWSRVKDAFDRYLKRLSKENQEMFGGERPDCCTLNRKQPADKNKR